MTSLQILFFISITNTLVSVIFAYIFAQHIRKYSLQESDKIEISSFLHDMGVTYNVLINRISYNTKGATELENYLSLKFDFIQDTAVSILEKLQDGNPDAFRAIENLNASRKNFKKKAFHYLSNEFILQTTQQNKTLINNFITSVLIARTTIKNGSFREHFKTEVKKYLIETTNYTITSFNETINNSIWHKITSALDTNDYDAIFVQLDNLAKGNKQNEKAVVLLRAEYNNIRRTHAIGSISENDKQILDNKFRNRILELYDTIK